jgi:thiamine-phosphate diphosphorylase
MNWARPCVYLITDRRQLCPDARTSRDEVVALERWLEDAPGVVDAVQIREPGLDAGILIALVRRVAARVAGSSTMVVVNDRADVAVASGASGVHLRGDGPSIPRVRALAHRDWIVGRSIHEPDEAEGPGRGADYLIFGSVFSSLSKAAAGHGRGIDALQQTVDRAQAPVLAIGGITPARAADCHLAGAAGVAAIGLFLPPGRRSDALGIVDGAKALRDAMAHASFPRAGYTV